MWKKYIIESHRRIGKTIFFITHSVEEAVYLGDRVVVMSAEKGNIQEVISIDLERPRHVYDERFMTGSHREQPFKRRNRIYHLYFVGGNSWISDESF